MASELLGGCGNKVSALIDEKIEHLTGFAIWSNSEHSEEAVIVQHMSRPVWAL